MSSEQDKDLVAKKMYVVLLDLITHIYIYIYIRDGSRFSNIRIVNLIIEYRLGYAIIF